MSVRPPEYIVILSKTSGHRGKPTRAACEDRRKAPSSSLVQDLDEMEYIYPRSCRVVDEEFQVRDRSRDFDRIPLEIGKERSFEAVLINEDPAPLYNEQKQQSDIQKLCHPDEAVRISETERELWMSNQRLPGVRICSNQLRGITRSILINHISLRINNRSSAEDIKELLRNPTSGSGAEPSLYIGKVRPTGPVRCANLVS